MIHHHHDSGFDTDGEWFSDSEPTPYGNRTTSHSQVGKMKQTADRLFARAGNVACDLARRGKIEMEIAAQRVKLRTTYSKLGELVFRMKVAEEGENVLASEEIQSLFNKVRNTHRAIATLRQKLQELKEMAHSDDYAGA